MAAEDHMDDMGAYECDLLWRDYGPYPESDYKTFKVHLELVETALAWKLLLKGKDFAGSWLPKSVCSYDRDRKIVHIPDYIYKKLK